jgi:hypothetical protein
MLEQWSDRTGAVRRGDHVLRRLDLLTDAELDVHWSRHGEKATTAFDTCEALAREMDKQLPELTSEARVALEARTVERPLLSVVVCVSCGEFAIAQVSRPWPIDRAMMRSGLDEREARAALDVLKEAFTTEATSVLDRLDADQLREVRALVGEDYDVEALRERFVRSGA